MKQHSQKKANLCLHYCTLETGEIYTEGRLVEYPVETSEFIWRYKMDF